MIRRFPIAALVAAVILTAGPAAAADAGLEALIGRYMARAGDRDALLAAAFGVPVGDPERLPDWGPERLAAIAEADDTDLRAVSSLDAAVLSPGERTDLGILRERLEANVQLRVCRSELWDVNPQAGWPALFVALAASQPVGDADARRAALSRWADLGRFVDVDIANLRRGLDLGYSAPKVVVRRAIAQVEQLANAPADASPYAAPARRDPDPAFKAAFEELVRTAIAPALRRYGDFLTTEYLPRARDSLAVSDLPNGADCYRALLRSNTTLDRPPAAVFAAGTRAVDANRRAVVARGRALFGLGDYDAIVARSRVRPENRFQSPAELLDYTRAVVAKAQAASARLVESMPRQAVVVEPLAPFEEAAGMGSRYQPSSDPAKPAVFRLQMKTWRTQTRAEAAITAVHETWPGHHLQIASASARGAASAFERLAFNAAYVEGWGRVAEGYGEELGIYDTPDAGILRRAWPACGMVVDPGIHAMGWSRGQAVAYIVQSGRFTATEAEDMVDRIAAMPGQLASYDTGAQEIERLRSKAERILGPGFDLRAFNTAVLGQGIVPLAQVGVQVDDWLARRKPAATPSPRSAPNADPL